MIQNQLTEMAQGIGDVGEQIGEAITIEVGRQHDDVRLVDQIPQQKPVIRIRDMLLDPPAPVLHAFLEVRWKQRNDAVDVLSVLDVTVHRIFSAHAELRAL